MQIGVIENFKRGFLALLTGIFLCLGSSTSFAQQEVIDEVQAQLEKHTSVDITRVDLLNKMANAYVYVSPEQSQKEAQGAYVLANRLNYIAGKAEATRVLGASLQARGNYVDDMAHFTIAYDLATSVDAKLVMARILRNMGTHYSFIADYQQAIEHLYESIRLAKEIEDYMEEANAHNNLGVVLSILKTFDEAGREFKLSYDLFKKLDFMDGMATAYNNIGDIAEKQDDLETALKYFTEGLEMSKQSGSQSGTLVFYLNLASVNFKQDNHQEAFSYVEKANIISRTIGSIGYQLAGESLKGDFSFQLGNYLEAENLYKDSLSIANDIGERETELDLLLKVVAVAKALSKHEEAVGFLERYNALRDEVYPPEVAQTLTILEARYKSEQQENEINVLRRNEVMAELTLTQAEQENQKLAVVIGFGVVLLILMGVGYRLKSNTTRMFKEKNETLKTLSEKLELANKAKSDFIANTSHEIRTPLNGILGIAQVLLGEAKTKNTIDKVSTIKAAGENLLRLLNDVLDLSKVEAGMLELDEHTFTIGSALNQVKEFWGPQFKGTAVEYHQESNMNSELTLYGDTGRLSQILNNLIGNAKKFTQQGQISLTVVGKHLGQQKWQLKFEVQDTGIGISETAKQKIFDRFSQEDGTINRKFGGTGLGLTISQKLVHMMGGEIGVESVSGAGSKFWFTILCKESEGEIKAPEAKIERAAINFARVPEILVAEDVDLNQRVIEMMLENFGANLTYVEDGQKALDAHNQNNFDLILMDIQMPVLDGVAAAKIIRDGDHNPDIAIIALTANALKGDRSRYLDAGMDSYLAKPLDSEKLISTIIKNLPKDIITKVA